MELIAVAVVGGCVGFYLGLMVRDIQRERRERAFRAARAERDAHDSEVAATWGDVPGVVEQGGTRVITLTVDGLEIARAVNRYMES